MVQVTFFKGTGAILNKGPYPGCVQYISQGFSKVTYFKKTSNLDYFITGA